MADDDTIKVDGAGTDPAPETKDNTSDEQLWETIASEEKSGDDTGPKDRPDDDPGEPDLDASSPGPSEDDNDGGDDPDQKTPAGTDPDALTAQIARLQHKVDSQKGRTVWSRREIESLTARITSAEEAKRDAGDTTQDTARRESLAAAQEEYGDVITPLVETITELEGRLDKLSETDAAELTAAKERQQALLAEERGVFETEHPDGFKTIIENRKAFNAWIDDQPRALRDTYAHNAQQIVDGQASAILVGRFKQALLEADGGPAPDPEQRDNDPLQTRRAQQLAGARTTQTRGRQSASSRPNKDSTDDEAHWNWARNLEARQDQ